MEIKSIVSWNVNSIRMRAPEVQVVIDRYDPTIICLQEIRTYEENAKKILKQFEHKYKYIYINSSTANSRHGGTAVISKVPALYQKGHFDDEGRLQILDFGEFVLYNAYVFCAQENLKRFDVKKQFLDDIKNDILTREGKNIVFTGDLNTSLKSKDVKDGKQRQEFPGFTKKEKKVMRVLMDETNLIDTFRHFQPTKKKYSFKGNKYYPPSRLDFFLVKEKMLQKYIKWSEVIYDTGFSGDHRIILLEFKQQNEEVDEIGQRLQLTL